MDLRAFSKPNGKFVNNGEGNATFVPNQVPPTISYDNELILLLSNADHKLGQLKGIGQLLPDPELLIRPYLRREAVLSSKIEGTQASISDLLQFEATGKETGNPDYTRILEVRNYVLAFRDGLEFIKNKKPIDLKLIKNAHKTLLHLVRGEKLNAGEFRSVQNWIGKEGVKIEDAVYVPPSMHDLDEALKNLIEFIQNPPKEIPPLIQCAIIHYQFEAIHPFADGNGRIGRLLISLFLAERDLLSQPLLYLSAYFERHRTDYYDGLLGVSQKSRWKEWLKFFLSAVAVQAEEATQNIQKLMKLRTKYLTMIRNRNSSKNALLLCEYLFGNPYVTVSSAKEYLGCSFPSAQTAIEFLIKIGILRELGKKHRNRLFVAHEIDNILR
jgi:Fic family protein